MGGGWGGEIIRLPCFWLLLNELLLKLVIQGVDEHRHLVQANNLALHSDQELGPHQNNILEKIFQHLS